MSFKVITGSLNVRRGPSIEEPILAVLSEGDVVDQLAGTNIVTEVSHASLPAAVKTWVRYDGADFQGWISLSNLTLKPDGIFEVTGASGANVRDEPTLSAAGAVLGTLSTGAKVPSAPLVAELAPPPPDVRHWLRLNTPAGWVSMLLLQNTANSPQVTTVKYKVTAQVLHVRSRPSIESAILGDIKKGITVSEGKITTADGQQWMDITAPIAGFIAMKFLVKVTSSGPAGTPPWFDIAKGQEGIKEQSGSADNPEVVKYLKSCAKLDRSSQNNDETPWCSAFVNWCVEQAGFEGTESAAARSWLNWGKSLPLAAPQTGCIVVLKRGPNPAFGHVGFFVKETTSQVFLLGGNQHDSVNVTAFDKGRVLGYRINR